MTKHILDKHAAKPKSGMIKAFTENDAKDSPTNATLELQRRSQTREGSARLRAFTQIEGGKQT